MLAGTITHIKTDGDYVRCLIKVSDEMMPIVCVAYGSYKLAADLLSYQTGEFIKIIGFIKTMLRPLPLFDWEAEGEVCITAIKTNRRNH